MKIVECINAIQRRGGAEVLATSLSKQLKREGNQVSFISLYGQPDKSLKSSLENNGIEPIYCNKKKGLDFKCVRFFKNSILKIEPDIIHLHLSVMPIYFLAFGFKKHRWHLVLTIHNVYKKDGQLSERIIRDIFYRRNRLAFVGISSKITDSCPQKKRSNIYTIENGFELFTTIQSRQKIYDFICVARFSPQKNHILLIRAFKELCNEDNNLKLALVGSGELMPRIKDECKKAELTNNVIFLGYTSNVLEYLEQSKMFVLSSHYEGNPISILEAMNAGLPIIAPSVGGIPDIVINERNGLLFEKNSFDGLKSCMEQLSKNMTKAKQMGSINKKDSLQYSINECAKKYLKLFGLLMERHY